MTSSFIWAIFLYQKQILYLKKKTIFLLLHCSKPTFDDSLVESATKIFIGTKDFTAFMSKAKLYPDKVKERHIESLVLQKGKPLAPLTPESEYFNFWEIACSGRSFLYKQASENSLYTLSNEYIYYLYVRKTKIQTKSYFSMEYNNYNKIRRICLHSANFPMNTKHIQILRKTFLSN